MSATELTSTQSFTTATEGETRAFAARLAALCKPGDCLLLQGDLGAGKTALARGFIQSLVPNTEVTSPTFNLVQTYDAAPATIWHFDLYRLKSPSELAEIGLDDALESGITLIEWPEIAQSHWPKHALTIQLQASGDSRTLTLSGASARWKQHFATLTE